MTSPNDGHYRNAASTATPAKQGNIMVFTTLGTQSGPIASPTRSQPAFLLYNDKQYILIDAGDGAAEQLAKVNVPLEKFQTIILTHLHIDHTGGLYAILGMRLQSHITGDLAIYGPPETKRLVDGLIAAQQPLMDLVNALGVPGGATPLDVIKVIEVADGSKFTVGDVSLTAATNTHYSFSDNSQNAARFQSLSYRFDTPDRAIVFTGDTGPSANIEKLARNADLLVSEIMDVDEALERLKQARPDIPAIAWIFVKKHLEDEHLTADEVGKLVQRSGAKSLVLVHNAGSARANERERDIITSYFKGPVAFANDLDNY